MRDNPDRGKGVVTPATVQLLEDADTLVLAARRNMADFALHQYLAAVFDVVSKANRYFASHEPWKLAKTGPAEMRVVLFTTIEVLRIVAILLQPIMPAAMSKLLDLLAVEPDRRNFDAVEVVEDFENFKGSEDLGRIAAPNRLRIGVRLPPPSPIFPRYVEDEAAAS